MDKSVNAELHEVVRILAAHPFQWTIVHNCSDEDGFSRATPEYRLVEYGLVLVLVETWSSWKTEVPEKLDINHQFKPLLGCNMRMSVIYYLSGKNVHNLKRTVALWKHCPTLVILWLRVTVVAVSGPVHDFSLCEVIPTWKSLDSWQFASLGMWLPPNGLMAVQWHWLNRCLTTLDIL